MLLTAILLGQGLRQMQPLIQRDPEKMRLEATRPLAKGEILRVVRTGGKTPNGVGFTIQSIDAKGGLRVVSNSYKKWIRLTADQLVDVKATTETWNLAKFNALPKAEHIPSMSDGSDVTLMWRTGKHAYKWEAFRFKYEYEGSPMAQLDELKLPW